MVGQARARQMRKAKEETWTVPIPAASLQRMRDAHQLVLNAEATRSQIIATVLEAMELEGSPKDVDIERGLITLTAAPGLAAVPPLDGTEA